MQRHENYMDRLTARVRLLKAIVAAIDKGGPEMAHKAIEAIKARVEYAKFKARCGLR